MEQEKEGRSGSAAFHCGTASIHSHQEGVTPAHGNAVAQVASPDVRMLFTGVF
jgi:hypothetical protein